MARRKEPDPAPLDPKVANRLLDLLSTDTDFRRLFKKDAEAALAKAGHRPPRGKPSCGKCLQLKPGQRIAPKAQIIRDRAKLETLTTRIMQFTGAKAFTSDRG